MESTKRKTSIILSLMFIIVLGITACAPSKEQVTETIEPTEPLAIEELAIEEEQPTEEIIEWVKGEELRVTNKPDSFVIDERYIDVIYEEVDFNPQIEVLRAVREMAEPEEEYTPPSLIYPDVLIYSFVDNEGEAQYRAYCELYEYEQNPDTEERIYAELPVEDSGALYPVILEVQETEEDNVYEVMIVIIDETPMVVENEPFTDESAIAKNVEKEEDNAPPTSTAISSGGNNAADNTGGGTSPAPATVAPQPSAAPPVQTSPPSTPEPSPSEPEVEYIEIGVYICKQCGYETEDVDEIIAHCAFEGSPYKTGTKQVPK